MPRRTPTAEVNVRPLAPEAATDVPAGLLYRPVPQITLKAGKPPFKISYEEITPELAEEYLVQAAMADNFRQRPLISGDVDRFANLLRTERFVHYLPDSAICFDEQGVQLNGQHRFNGIVRSGIPAGFVVFRNVPRWMFAYMDTGKKRTIKHVLHINNRSTGPQTASAMALALRYEEFLQGVRPSAGWRHWNAVKDEPQDADEFYSRRTEIQDGYRMGVRVYNRAKILIPSVMTFLYYQTLAWPDGNDAIEEFLDELASGSALSPQRPARHLRDFTLEVFGNKTPVIAKREVHLMLLMLVFAQEMNKSRIHTMPWAYGHPMTMPYHPKGHEVAVKNVRLALDEIDRESLPEAA